MHSLFMTQNNYLFLLIIELLSSLSICFPGDGNALVVYDLVYP